SRGGAVTFPGPGKLVMYPISRRGAGGAAAADGAGGVRGYLGALEEVAIRTAEFFGVRAWRRTGMTGAWTEGGKLAAIGVRFRRWVSYHGMSFNVNPDLSGFAAIIPCGLAGEEVASLEKLLGKTCPSLREVRDAMAGQFSAVFNRELSAPDSRLSLAGNARLSESEYCRNSCNIRV
ncbi:MAG: lipoyl(octanoyl) transferase LipB, partial [Kiritimatiellae bacterium]|nr:lipoyl(octanoyl) transferase LipB [Kiritimatiellia bacterium]